MSGRKQDGTSWIRRKNRLTITALSPLSPDHHDAETGRGKAKKLQTHNRTLTHVGNTVFGDANGSSVGEESPHSTTSTDAKVERHSPVASRSLSKRGQSMFGSLRQLRLSSEEPTAASDDLEPLSAVSTTAPSVSFGDDPSEGPSQTRLVLARGEVQTSAGLFRKKKEYLVLTDTHLLRYKSQARAAEVFQSIPSPSTSRKPLSRHGSMPSVGSQASISDIQTISDSSGDKHGRISLRQVVAVHRTDDGRSVSTIDICCLDEDTNQPSTLSLQFASTEERDGWLQNIRHAARQSRIRELAKISNANLEHVARTVERGHDYDPSNCAVYKVVQKSQMHKSAGRVSMEDQSRISSTICFLAVGIHKIHLILPPKPHTRTQSISLASNALHESYGILTLLGMKISASDDTFEMVFRQPMQKPKHLILASAASYEIGSHLYAVEGFLRPEYGHRLTRFSVPKDVEGLMRPLPALDEDHSCLVRTLSAYCIAYDLNPSNIRYMINYECEDAPCFELHPPADVRKRSYSTLELLAVMRALRYNESFGSVSFAGIPLNELNQAYDSLGHEFVCSQTKRGTPLKLTPQQLMRSSLLAQEIRAIAASSKKLRRMDFSNCIVMDTPFQSSETPEDSTAVLESGCGIAEALFPLCRQQTTNVDWICLNGIELSDTDLDYMIGAAVDKSCHLRSLELNRCNLTDRSLGLILDALRAQENTLEAIEIAGNAARINPVSFDSQLGVFGFIRKLNLSNTARTSGAEPLLTTETLLIWRLQDLRLSGTVLNASSVDALATYLSAPQSASLRELHIDNTHLSGSDAAVLLRSLGEGRSEAREMTINISQNQLAKDVDRIVKAITEGFAPTHVQMRAIEYPEEYIFRKIVTALTKNTSIRSLDMSQTALPGDASEETSSHLHRLFAENNTIQELDISGEDSRLATSVFGPGLNKALTGLMKNKTLLWLRIEKQKLGIQGASTLADVVKENSTLRELHCDNNDIPLQGLTDLVNALIDNTTLIYLPTMDDGRAAAFKSAELTMKGMAAGNAATPLTQTKPTTNSAPLAMRRGLASIRHKAARTSSAYTPSFPALSSFNRTEPATGGGIASAIVNTSSKSKGNTGEALSPTTFTVQDIQTTQRLLSEQWDRQCFRLAQYLDRNWCILHNVPVNMEVEDEKFERPQSAGSLSKMLEQVKFDTTPRAEKTLYFDVASPEKS